MLPIPLNVADPTPAQLNLERLLRSGVLAARNGHRTAARDLFLALSRSYPGDVRVWLGLAGVSASAYEQREALEQVLALDPSHAMARHALAQLAVSPSLEPAPLPEPVGLAPDSAPSSTQPAVEPLVEDDPPPPVEPQRFPLMNALALGMIALLVVVLVGLFSGIIPGFAERSESLAPIPSPVLQIIIAPTGTAQGSISTPAIAAAPTILAVSTPTPAQAPPAAGLPAQASLPLGTLIEVDGWSITLLRPDYALILDGSIGDLRPRGHFVLALMAISNNSAEARHIPVDLFTIVDSRSRQYKPTPNASTAYLALYERGQHGDLALEDSLTAHSGMRSVPILFDVPTDASGLVLTIRNSGSAGWLIDDTTAPAVNVGP